MRSQAAAGNFAVGVEDFFAERGEEHGKNSVQGAREQGTGIRDQGSGKMSACKPTHLSVCKPTNGRFEEQYAKKSHYK